VNPNPLLLSIVIPAYNEERRLPQSLAQIDAFLAAQPYSAEVIVVDNASSDRTAEVVRAFASSHAYVTLLYEGRRGKGAAVRTGMLAGRGQFLFICDADLSMPITEINKFLPPTLDSYDVAIASREAPGAVRYEEPEYRHIMGRVFNLIVRILAIPGFQDTQCGFKCFRRDADRDIFPAQTMEGFGFDVEVLFIALQRGYRVVEVPIHWYYRANSRVSPIRDSIRMFRDVVQVRLNGWRGRYNRPPHVQAGPVPRT
jgi:glycosyltransferase involved in cell wall biosynthesis